MTRKLFYEDSHIKEFEAKVIDCIKDNDAYQIILDQTAFFPEGGGQTSDTGRILDIEVYDVREKDDVIYHYTKEPLIVGQSVVGVIDYKERFSKMQQHTGEHIISGLVNRYFGYDNVGFHLGKEKVTMDFNGDLTSEDLRKIELEANEVVARNLKIEVLYPSKEELKNIQYRSKIEIEGQVRIVEIPGIDCCACCAPHVKYTGEIGIIKIIDSEKYKGGIRVSMLCGFRALEDYNMKEQNVNKISVLLSAKPEKISVSVENLKNEISILKGRIFALQEKQVAEAINQIKEDATLAILFDEELDNNAMRKFVNGAMEKCKGLCGAFVGNDLEGYRYILGSKTIDVRDTAKMLNEAFSGKGGGKPEMVQGSLHGTKANIEQLLS
ncbi:alanyl-tRNA editing protein [Clostridium sp. Marseille-P299]|uniref:alanyl-tRNA editing protein n=1 Tax=Clostridium sp. Marseille-P299 TaxID=1805477 RepID=UPI00082D9CF0|nr:alanine--tRNA ligase-related protein [Clostridium sp. Marseille-P299]